MLRAEKVIAAGGWTGEPADSVLLGYEERCHARFAMTGVSGLSFQLDLPEAVMLRGGDGLSLEDGRIVEVVAAPEPLAEIRASDTVGLLRIAWRLGASRHEVELLPKAVRVRRDPAVEEMAKSLGARVVTLEAPFNPEGGTYVHAPAEAHGDEHHAHGHGHGRHEHSHASHGHDHDDHRHHDHGDAGHDHDCDHPDHHHGQDGGDHRHDHGHPRGK